MPLNARTPPPELTVPLPSTTAVTADTALSSASDSAGILGSLPSPATSVNSNQITDEEDILVCTPSLGNVTTPPLAPLSRVQSLTATPLPFTTANRMTPLSDIAASLSKQSRSKTTAVLGRMGETRHHQQLPSPSASECDLVAALDADIIEFPKAVKKPKHRHVPLWQFFDSAVSATASTVTSTATNSVGVNSSFNSNISNSNSNIGSISVSQAAYIDALQPGSHFFGKQSSGDRSFDLEIRFNSLNLADSTLTGYLTIYGLARSGEPMQTFFDAEIIGSNHSFITREWGASAEIDLQYWQTFPEFEQLRKHFTADVVAEEERELEYELAKTIATETQQKLDSRHSSVLRDEPMNDDDDDDGDCGSGYDSATELGHTPVHRALCGGSTDPRRRRCNTTIKSRQSRLNRHQRSSSGSDRLQPALPFDFTDHDVIFMRWKERFLLPDHRITAVHGAVYDGFYYTCLNRTNRTISGIYFSPATPSSATGLLHLTQMSPAFLVGQTTVAELDSHKQQQHSTDSDIECHHDRNRPFVQQQLYPPATYTFN